MSSKNDVEVTTSDGKYTVTYDGIYLKICDRNGRLTNTVEDSHAIFALAKDLQAAREKIRKLGVSVRAVGGCINLDDYEVMFALGSYCVAAINEMIKVCGDTEKETTSEHIQVRTVQEDLR